MSAAIVTRILCPHLWDSGPIVCRQDGKRRVVTTVCGDVAKTVPLVVRYRARSTYAEWRAQLLKKELEEWGYARVELVRGLKAC